MFECVTEEVYQKLNSLSKEFKRELRKAEDKLAEIDNSTPEGALQYLNQIGHNNDMIRHYLFEIKRISPFKRSPS